MSKKFNTVRRVKRPYFNTPSRKEPFFVILNLIILISTIIITIIDIRYGTSGGQDGASVSGWDYFRPFTIDSNILMATAAALALIKIIKQHITTKQKEPAPFSKTFGPKFTNFYFLSVVSISLTFVVVALFLAPLRFMHGQDGLSMFMGDMFFFHLINPIAAVCALLFFDGVAVSRVGKALCCAPMALYSTVYGFHVLVLGDWEDFYNFTFGGNLLLTAASVLVNVFIVYILIKLLSCVYDRRATDAIVYRYQQLKYKQPSQDSRHR